MKGITNMQRSGSQKALLVLSIIKIVVAILGILFGAVTFYTIGSASVADLSSAAAETGISTESFVGIGLALGFVMLAGSLVDIIMGILGVRAANDCQKIMPVWWLALIALILGVLGIVMSVVQGNMSSSQLSSDCGSIIFSLLIFWVANNIKRQAGK